MRLPLENNSFDHISSSKMFASTQVAKKSEYLLFPQGMYVFEIWHNPLNGSAPDRGGGMMKKKKIYENRQMNLGTLLALGEKSHEISASALENTVYVPHYTT